MRDISRLLRSPRLALGVLGFLAAYCALASWLPGPSEGAAAPGWVVALRLERPFASPLFLVAVGLLFVTTLACLWDRTPGTLRLWRGQGEGYATTFESRPPHDFAAFLRAEGFRGTSRPLFRFRHALWGGWVLHLGLVVLIAGVAVQQGFHDGGAFEVSEGERLSLSATGAVFARERGPLAPETPPELVVTLVAYDPFLHQPGYAPDRASRISVERPGGAATEVTVDRAEGIGVGAVTIYQAIPSGLALNLQIAGFGGRSLHLRETGPRSAEGTFTTPGGETVRLGVSGARDLDDPRGTGALTAWIERRGQRSEVVAGTRFPFGATSARLVSIGRWAGFTYARSPGMPAVFAGFAIILLGSTMLAFPAGVAWPDSPEEGAGGRVFVTRGRELLLAEWATREHNPHTHTEEA
jgi:hypothetical protein